VRRDCAAGCQQEGEVQRAIHKRPAEIKGRHEKIAALKNLAGLSEARCSLLRRRTMPELSSVRIHDDKSKRAHDGGRTWRWGSTRRTGGDLTDLEGGDLEVRVDQRGTARPHNLRDREIGIGGTG
jgi:hypothetical protein